LRQVKKLRTELKLVVEHLRKKIFIMMSCESSNSHLTNEIFLGEILSSQDEENEDGSLQ
jgi:hypothetical protein